MAHKEFIIKKGAVIYSQGQNTVVLDVQGSQGQLFSVTDNLTGLLHSVNDISGIPILEVYSDNRVLMGTYGAIGLEVNGSNVLLPNLQSAITDTDKFLVLDGTVVKFRTGVQLLSDIGGQPLLTNPVTGTGTSGQVTYWNSTSGITGNNNLFWDNTNARLGIGTNTPEERLTLGGSADQLIRVNGSVFPGYIGTTSEVFAISANRRIIGGTLINNSITSAYINLRTIASNSSISFFLSNSAGVQPSELFRMASTGNFLIGTTTDAGFRLDVSGTTRITGAVTIDNTLSLRASTGTTATHIPVFTADPSSTTRTLTTRTPAQLLGDAGGISGTIASGQVAFGTGTNSIGGDSGLTWDNVNKRLRSSTLNVGTNSNASLHVNVLKTGTSDVTVGNITLDSRITGLIIEASTTQNGSNLVRPGIYMFNSRNDGSGLAFPLFRIYTGANDTYSNTRGGTIGALSSNPATDFNYLYFGVNSRQDHNNNILRIGENGIWINPPSSNTTIPNVPLRVRGSGTTASTNSFIIEDSNLITRLIFNDAGNLLLNTLTDAGFRLDVSGTTRITGTLEVDTVNNGAGDFLTRDANGVITRRTAAEVRTDISAEPSFSKGNIIEGNAISLSGTLTNRLVGTGDITISHSDTSTQASVDNSNGTVIQDITLDTYGHITGIGSIDLDTRYYTETEVNTLLNSYQLTSQKGIANGYASLDAAGKIPSAQLPSYVDDVLEFSNLASFPLTGETGIIYVTLDTNKTYRWSGTTYIEISPSDVNSVFGRTGIVTAQESDYQSFYPRLSQSYDNPSWINTLAWSKITNTPTTLSGYSITDAYTKTEINNFFSGTTVISGYNKTNWDLAYNNRIDSLTTIGSSGPATLSGNTLNIPNYTLSGLGAIGGTISTGQVAFGTGTNTIGGNNNLFWDNTNGRFGIANNSPLYRLTIGSAVASSLLPSIGNIFVSEQAGSNVLILHASADNSAQRAIFQGSKSRGTLLSPTAVLSGDFITTFLSGAFDGTSLQNSAGLFFDAESNASAGSAPQLINLVTGSTSANRTTKLQVRSNGNVIIQNGGTFTDAGFRLDVNGTARVTGNFTIDNSLSLRASTGTTATHIPVFTADPSSTTRTLVTRTSAQLLSDIGGQVAGSYVQRAFSTDTVPIYSGDLNSHLTGFIYSTGTNRPFNTNSTVVSVALNNNYGFQISGRNTVFGYRTLEAGIWGTWQQIYKDDYHPNADTLTTTRTIWGQNFNGSANVTGALSDVTTIAMSGQLTNTVATGTAPFVISSTTRVNNLNVATAGTADTWTTARTLTIGSTGKSVNGSSNVSWSLAEIGAAATDHKYHAFANNSQYFDAYTQANYLRLFTETATFDNFRFKPYTNVQFWDGSSWVAWAQSLDTLFDGREETGFNIGPTNKQFRFEITRDTGWPTTALFVLQTTWSNVTSPTCSVLLETWNGSTWVQKDSWTYTAFTLGLNLKTTEDTHDGFTQMRVTITLNWTAATHDYIVLRRILFLSNYSGVNSLQPFTWNYNRNVTFSGNITATSIIRSGGTSSQFLKADGSVDTNAYSTTSHNHTLDSLSNVTITSNTNGEILRWNGTAWINNTLAEAGIQAVGSYVTLDTTQTVTGAKTIEDLTIGKSLGTTKYIQSLSIILPAIGTKVAFLNVGINSIIKVELHGSENGFYQPIVLTIARNSTGATITINKDNPFFHEHSNDIAFSFDTTTGNIFAEKTLYTTGRNFRVSKVEILFGTAAVLDGSLTTTTGVGTDQSVTRVGRALYITGTNTVAQGNVTASSFIRTGGTASQFLKADGSVDSTAYQPLLTNPVTGTGTSGQVSFWNGSTSQTGSNNLFWDNANSRLGIGTNSPLFRVHVLGTGAGDSTFTGGILIDNNNVTDGEPTLAFRVNSMVAGGNYWFTGLNQSGNYSIAYGGGFTDANTFFRLQNNGNVLIGTTTDGGQKLQVTGTVAMRASTGTTATHIPVFTADPSSTTRTITTRTPAELLSDIGGVSGTGTSGQVAFWSGTSSQTGDARFTFVDGRMTINRTTDSRITLQDNSVTTLLLQALSTSGRISGSISDLPIEFWTGGTYRWGIISGGILQSNGSQTIRTSTGLLSFQNLGGNVAIGTTTDAGFRLDVNGTARVQGNTTVTGNLTVNTNTLFVDSSNNRVGIGITTPSHLLSVHSTTVGTNTVTQKISANYDSSVANRTVQLVLGGAEALIGSKEFRVDVSSTLDFFNNPTFAIYRGDNANKNTFFISTLGNIGVNNSSPSFNLDVAGTTRLNGLQTFQGTTASDTAPLGSELATTGSGTNWTGTGFATGYTHTVGSTASLTTSIPAVNGTYYQIAYTITGRTAGSITINYGGTSTASITATGATGPLATSTANLEIVPTTDFDGTVVLSVRSIGTSTATTTINDSGGNSRIQIRATSSASNTLVGNNAGRRITTGTLNSFFGSDSGRENTTGSSNAFFGRSSGFNNNVGLNNSFFGASSGQSNTTGNSNSFFGTASGINTTTASNNSFFGTASGQSNILGESNSYFGNSSALNVTSGSNNVFVGRNSGRFTSAGSNLTVSDNSILLGFETRPNGDSQTNQTVIGYQAIGLGSNTTVIGNSSTTFGRWWGNLLLGTSTNSGFLLDVNGTARVTGILEVDTVNNGVGDFLTRDVNGVITRRTAAQVLSDIGAQPITNGIVTGSGSLGQVTFWSSTSGITGDNNFFWDNTNKRLGINTSSPSDSLDISGTTRIRVINNGIGDFITRDVNGVITRRTAAETLIDINAVPYTGATKNVNLGEYGLYTGFIKLDTTPTNTPTEQGTIYWDDSQETAALIMNGTIQHIGQDTFYYVKNSTGNTILKGTTVRFAGTDGNSGHLLVAPFIANGTVPSSYFMGVASENIPNGGFGKVMHFGKLDGINTSAYADGDILYASTTVAGGYQTTVPLAPNNIIIVAAVVSADNNGKLMVRPSLGSNINNDEGVLIQSPLNNQLLSYTTANGLWENKSLGTIIGGTSSQFLKGDGTLDSTVYTPTSRSLTFTTNNGISGGGPAVDFSVDRSWTFGLTGQALALHNLSTNGIIVRTGSGTVSARTITAGTGISITNGDGVGGDPVINTTITQYTDALARTAISLTTTGNSGAATYNNTTGVFNIPNYTLAGLGGEPVFTKGNIVQGNGITLTGTLTSRLVGSDNITIEHSDTSTQATVTNTNGNVIQSITLDTYGHITLLNSLDLDTRYFTQTQINSTLTNYQLLSERGQANGYAPLDSNSKIPLANLPDTVLGQVEYISTWNANTNNPTLPNPTTVKGNYYVVSTAGTVTGATFQDGSISFDIGDWVISNGSVWQKVDNTDTVVSVFGRIGAISALATDYNGFYVRHDTASQGLNSTQQGNARTNIDAQVTITGGASTVTTNDLTVNRALISDASGKIAVSNVSNTELSYLVGVTSSIQTQLNNKLSANQSITLSGDVTGTGNTSIATTISNNVVTDAKLRQSAAYSVIGRSFSTTGNVADIVAGSDSVLRRSGTGDLIFGTLVTGNIGDSQITYAKIQNVTADRLLGRITTNGVVQELTAAQIRTLINVQEGANLYTHPTYTAINQTLNGATVLATFTTDTIGSVTAFTTRTLTAADISAVPTSRTLTFTTNNGLTGGGAAVDLTANRSFTFGLTGQALALHNLSTNGIIVRTAADTVTTRTITGGNGISVTNGDGISGNPVISLSASTYSFNEETFTYTGSTNFTISVTTPFAVEVFINGQRQVKTLDWTISGNVVTVSAPLDTANPDEILISYFYNTPDIVLPGLTGSGTTNFVTKWGSSSGLTSSIIYDNGINIGISENNPQAKLDIDGNARIQTIPNGTGDILTTDINGNVTKRTPAQILADIGGVVPMYKHTQTSASTTWVITHNLNFTNPIVSIYNNDNKIIIPDEIESTNNNTITVTFTEAVSGYATIAGGSLAVISETQALVNSLIFG